MAHGITPGLLATLLGVQPILTLLLTERRFSIWRLVGLLLALTGLMLVVYQSLILAKLSGLGMGFALGALLCMTFGAMLQKRVQQVVSSCRILAQVPFGIAQVRVLAPGFHRKVQDRVRGQQRILASS